MVYGVQPVGTLDAHPKEVPWLITEHVEHATTLEEDLLGLGLAIDGDDVIAQLSGGLAYVQSRGVVHTALTPENILMVETRDEFVPKIARLGQSHRTA